MAASPEEPNAIDPERDDTSTEQKAMRGFFVGVVGVGIAVLTFLITMRLIAVLDERWQVSSHGSSESIALLVFITIALALIAVACALPLIAAWNEEAATVAPILLVLSVLSAGLLALLVAFRERIDLSVGGLFTLAALLLWAIVLTLDTVPKLMRRIPRSRSRRRSIDGPR